MSSPKRRSINLIFIRKFETLRKLNPRVSGLYKGVSVPSDTCLKVKHETIAITVNAHYKLQR